MIDREGRLACVDVGDSGKRLPAFTAELDQRVAEAASPQPSGGAP